MLNAIISGLFSLVAKLGDLILSPIISVVSALIPDFSTFYTSIVNWLGQGFQYIGWAYKLLCIPKACMTLVYTVSTISLSIVLGVRVYSLILRIYNKFKF